MAAKEFDSFRLVGGTALSLNRGHRISVDIDLFTDAEYGSVNFKSIDAFLRNTFNIETSDFKVIGHGKSYYVTDGDASVKLDIYYTEKFIRKAELVEGIRLATVEEIIAMKLEVVSNGARKKDLWDLHELLDDFSLNEMIALHSERYEYSHDPDLIRRNFLSFDNADDDLDPECLRGKYWELIKLDLVKFVEANK
ncbi:MAG: nucleotidyl transferase AbiEii/AbiGii toxin family protein [Bacteroidota bacterium]|nr:nucleotidyl transferase AbiEii/AbiGii toxin family protein [Bacteroidota bacterium]